MENKDNFIQARIDECLAVYERVRDKIGDEASAVAILQEVCKDRRMAEMQADRANGYGHGNGYGNGQSNQSSGTAAATPAQKRYLKTLGVAIPENLTKKKASELIDDALENEEKESYRVPSRIP